jgi:hypothetical protein
MSTVVWLLHDRDLAGWRAFVWTASQMLTGGSTLGVSSPEVHALGIVLQLWAVFAIAALAGALGAFFHRRGLVRDPLPPVGPENVRASSSVDADRA